MTDSLLRSVAVDADRLVERYRGQEVAEYGGIRVLLLQGDGGE